MTDAEIIRDALSHDDSLNPFKDHVARLLDALEQAQAQLEAANHELSEIHQGLTNPHWFTNGPRAAHMHALNWSHKSAERRAAAMKGQT